MLPVAGIQHFHNVVSAALADAARDLSGRLAAFARDETTRGGGVGQGWAARLAGVYSDEVALRSKIIFDTCVAVHEDFEAPLGDGVEGQLQRLASEALSGQFAVLDGSYGRQLERVGLHRTAGGFSLVFSAEMAGLQTKISRHMWTLKNVPASAAASRQTGMSAPSPPQVHFWPSGQHLTPSAKSETSLRLRPMIY